MLAAGAVLFAVFIFRQDLAAVGIRQALTDSGLNAAALRVEQADLGRLVLSEVSVGPETAVAIRRLSVAYSPTELLKRRIDRVDVQGLHLAVRARSDGVSVDGLDAIIPRGPGDDEREWTIAAIGIADTSVSVGGAVGARLTIGGEVLAIGDNRYRGDLHFEGNAGLPDAESARVEGTIAFTASAAEVEEANLSMGVRGIPLPHLGTGTLDASVKLQNGDVHAEGAVQVPTGQVAFDLTSTLPRDGDWGALRGTGTLKLDLAEVAIENANVTLSAKGRVEASIDGDFLAVRALEPVEIKAATRIGPVTVRLEPAAAPVLSARHDRGLVHSAGVHAAEATVTAVGRSFSINEGDATIMLHPSPILELHSLSLADGGQPQLLPQLRVTGRATLKQANIPFSATVATADGKAKADMTGTWDRESASAEADIKLHPLRFVPGAFQPRDLAPALNFPISDVRGSLSAQGSLGWRDERIRSNLRVRAENMALTVNRTRLQGIAGSIRLTGLDPPTTPGKQVITIDRIDAGVPLEKAEMRFQLDAQRRLHIERAQVDLLGGRVSQTKAAFDTAKQSYRGTLEVTGISLQSLLDLAELDGATATGQVGGRIPIAYDRGELSIDDGTLATEAPGVLRYTPASAPAALKAQGESVGLALQALEDFHYDSLSVVVDGGSGRGWTSELHITGKNPEFMEGYPFVFNINLSGDLDRVVLSGLLGMTLPDRIQDRLKQ